MRHVRKSILLIFIAPALVGWVPYIVQKGDTLSEIGKQTAPELSVWGEDGSVALIYNRNRAIIKNPDSIFKGQKIWVPGRNQLPLAVKSDPLRVPAEAVEPPSEPAPLVPAAPTKVIEERAATLQLSFLLSLWDRNLVDKTTGAKGTVRSKSILGFSIDNLFPISEKWDIETGMLYRKIEFLEAPNRTLTADSNTYLQFRIGANRSSQHSKIGAGIEYEQLPLVTGVSASSVGVTSFNVFSPYVKGEWKIHQYGRTDIGLGGKILYNMSGTNSPYKLESGYAAELSLPIVRSISNTLSFGVSPFAEYGKHDTNTVEHTEINGGLKTRFLWNF